jgi:hypothetical protein
MNERLHDFIANKILASKQRATKRRSSMYSRPRSRGDFVATCNTPCQINPEKSRKIINYESPSVTYSAQELGPTKARGRMVYISSVARTARFRCIKPYKAFAVHP